MGVAILSRYKFSKIRKKAWGVAIPHRLKRWKSHGRFDSEQLEKLKKGMEVAIPNRIKLQKKAWGPDSEQKENADKRMGVAIPNI